MKAISANRALWLLLIMAPNFTLIPIRAVAADYADHWAAPYIDQAGQRGWLAGEGDFRPDAPITRGELADMLWRALGSPAPLGDCAFGDVAQDAFYRTAVTSLHEAGIISGYGNGLFGPHDTLTREMAFVMLARAFALKPGSAATEAAHTKFADHAQISAWAIDASNILVLEGYVEGSAGQLMPKKALTRGEMVKMLITVYDGKSSAPNASAATDTMPPIITLTQDPTTDSRGSVLVRVTVESKNGVAYLGWRSSSSSPAFTDNSGFTDITGAQEFSVSSNGWYAVCAVDNAGNFNFNVKQISNILPTATITLAVHNREGGSVSLRGMERDAFYVGDTATVIATPDEDYIFMAWVDSSGKYVSYETKYSFTVTGDVTLTAHFMKLAKLDVQPQYIENFTPPEPGVYPLHWW